MVVQGSGGLPVELAFVAEIGTIGRRRRSVPRFKVWLPMPAQPHLMETFGVAITPPLNSAHTGFSAERPLLESSRGWRVITVALMSLLLISLLRTAWLCDDAYITFRTADNIAHGYGPVWNIGERVQAYTHPLWLALCTTAFVLTGNVFYTAIALGIALTLAAVALMATRLASNGWSLVACFAAILSSKAFLDFSTSGLENPLSHLLLLVFVWQWWEEPAGPTRLRRLAFIASLCLLNRMDLVFLIAPPLAFEVWRIGPWRAMKPLLTGLLPFIAWLAFSTWYYGTPFPNTAYAKLNTTMTLDVQVRRGVDYFYRTFTGDPATFPVMLMAVASVVFGRRSDWPLALGILFSALYVLRIGGDFMMGRFFSAPFLLSVALLARAVWIQRRAGSLLITSAVLILGLLAPWEPALLSGYGYAYVDNFVRGRQTREPSDKFEYIFVRKIMDERREYSEFAGLVKVVTHRGGAVSPDHEWALDGLRLRTGGPQVVVRSFIGLTGYFAGPQVHIIDRHALSDPLLARIPGGTADSVMGHFLRDIPDGYVETIATRENRLSNRDLAEYYGPLREIVAGPLWNAHRLVVLVRFLSGHYDQHLARYTAHLRQS